MTTNPTSENPTVLCGFAPPQEEVDALTAANGNNPRLAAHEVLKDYARRAAELGTVDPAFGEKLNSLVTQSAKLGEEYFSAIRSRFEQHEEATTALIRLAALKFDCHVLQGKIESAEEKLTGNIANDDEVYRLSAVKLNGPGRVARLKTEIQDAAGKFDQICAGHKIDADVARERFLTRTESDTDLKRLIPFIG